MRPIDLLLSRLDKVQGRGTKFQARCPAHEDRSPSLSIKEATDGRVLIHCHAGCEVADIVESVGLTLGDLFPDETKTAPAPRPEDFENEKTYLDLALAHKKQGLDLDPLVMNRVELALHRIKTGKKLGVIQ